MVASDLRTMNTGNELLKHRQNLGLSRREFAQKVSFSEKTLQNFENLKEGEIPQKHIETLNKVFRSFN